MFDEVLKKHPEVMYRGYDNYWDFLEKAKRKPLSDMDSSRDPGGRCWSGSTSFEETVDWAERGWNKEIKCEQFIPNSVKEYVKEVSGTSYSWDTCGAIPDVERYCSGLPEDMIDFVQSPIQKRIISLGFNGAILGGIDPESVEKRGSFICECIDLIESMGFQCNVTAIFLSAGQVDMGKGDIDDGFSLIGVDLKNAGYVMNPDIIKFAACNASFFRRLIFSIRENDEIMYPKYLKHTDSYGRTSEFEDIGDVEHGFDVYFPHLDDNDFDEIVQKTLEQMEECGVVKKGVING